MSMSTASDPKPPPPSGPDAQIPGKGPDPFYPGEGPSTSSGGGPPFPSEWGGGYVGDRGYEYQHHVEYPPHHRQPQPQQQWSEHWTAAAARPVSACTAYPSPGHQPPPPPMPVSPMSAYFPDVVVDQQQPELQPQSQPQPQPQLRVSSYYYPGAAEAPDPDPDLGGGSPCLDLPAFMIPGGDRSRAVSFASVARVGGAPRVAQLVGPRRPPVPSIAVVVEGQSPTRYSHGAMP
ncbi:hypothetical protein VTK56DRAFT_5303 [Thermocarpiscus australiensis]